MHIFKLAQVQFINEIGNPNRHSFIKFESQNVFLEEMFTLAGDFSECLAVKKCIVFNTIVFLKVHLIVINQLEIIGQSFIILCENGCFITAFRFILNYVLALDQA